MNQSCPFCQLLLDPKSDPTFTAEFEHSVAFLGYNQDTYLGTAILILKEHYDHLHLIPLSQQGEMLKELQQFTKAILDAFGGFRVNHMSLGNEVSHMHWHIIPRYHNDLNHGHSPITNGNFTKLSDDGYKEIANKIRSRLIS